MKLESVQLGLIEYSEAEIIHFDDGLYGFSEAKDFILVGEMNEDFPFMWMQSIQTPELAFIITSPFLFVENYDFELPDAVTSKMDISSVDDILIYCLTVIPEDVTKTTINLKAPIILNRITRAAKQVILNEDYPYKNLIFNK